jgi:hypothetical protein
VDSGSVVGSLHRVEVRSVADLPGVHAASFDEEDGGIMRLRNVGNTAHIHTVRRLKKVINLKVYCHVQSNFLHGLVQE